MLPSTDQGHFYKYLTTLGVAVSVGSIGVGGVLLQVQSDLLIEQSKLSQITPTAREALLKKQDTILLVTEWAPWVVGLLALSGVVLAITGLVGWKRRQDTLDERDRAELTKLLAEIELMSDQEKENKAEEEAAEIVQYDLGRRGYEISKADDDVSDKSGRIAGVKASDAAIGRMKFQVITLERELVSKLQQAYQHRIVQAGVRTYIDRRSFEIDAMVIDELKHRVYLYELKLFSKAVHVPRARESANALAEGAAGLAKNFPGYDMVPVLVILLDEVSISRRERIFEMIQSASDESQLRIVVLIYSAAEFAEMSPSSFRDDINHGRNKRARLLN